MIEYLKILLNISLLLAILMLIYFAFTFFNENEKRAGVISVIMALLFSLSTFYINYFDNDFINIITQISVLLLLAITLLIVLPIKKNRHIKAGTVLKRFDERDVMFSRAELEIGTKLFDNYYKANPDKKILDDIFRSKFGLLNRNAKEFNVFKFASADANFDTIESFVPFINEDNLSDIKTDIKASELSDYIKKWIKQTGAVSVGITHLKPHHLYSVKGRGLDYGKEVVNNHKYAIAFTVEMDKDMIDAAPKAEAIIESSQQYLESSKIAIQLTNFIRRLGYSAKPHFDGNYDLICPVVAKDAGLGEFGRMGLLMTPELGPRVRIAVVTTDIPLVIDDKKYEPSVIDFCIICKKCADNCPASAISFDKMKDENGVIRWKINHESCFTYWNITGTDCGKCIQVCPYSHPNNLMHNLVRKGISNSYIFANAAIKMDDLFYGRKPKSKLGKF